VPSISPSILPRRLLVALVVTASVTAGVAPASATSCLAGSGTALDPFRVTSAVDLAKVGTDAANGCTLGAHYRQTADISLPAPVAPATSNHTPIGTLHTPFTGHYDGGGHRIVGLTIRDPAAGFDLGLFGVTQGAALRGIRLDRIEIVGKSRIGGIAGFSWGGTLAASAVEGSITGEHYVGGLIGATGYFHAGPVHRAEITASSARVAVVESQSGQAGGLIGQNADGVIRTSYADGSVTGTWRTGGLVGENIGGRIEDSYASTVVQGSTAVGGLVGEHSLGGSALRSYWDAGRSTLPSDGDARGTAAMRSAATYVATGWHLSTGWQPFDAGVAEWGICAQVNGGYPFLLWEYDADPCVVQVAVGPSVSVSCAGPMVAGATVSCVVVDGPADVGFVWRAAYNPVFAEGVVRTGADGTGAFAFTMPAAAVGRPVSVELVAWTAPVVVGTAQAGGPVPVRIPAGGGPPPFALMLLLGAVGIVARRGARVQWHHVSSSGSDLRGDVPR
jgi:hypothetical protein